MDYRLRKYYFVSFAWSSYDMRMEIIKNIPTVKISSPYLNCTKVICGNRCADLNEMYYKIRKHIGFKPQMIVSCHKKHAEQLEYELRKTVRRDGGIYSDSYFCEITKELVGQ